MSKSHGYSNKHALPPNPSFLDFPRSDGDSAVWPTNTTRIVDSEGCVNYMQHVGLDEPLSVKWRVGVGDALSVALKLPGGPSYVLRDFPSGYRMFDHHKGKADNPRHDVYLFGSESKSRFRSVPEFIPHALWLMGDGIDSCKCKYCTKKPQREITSSMGDLLRTSHSPSPSRPPRSKVEKPEKKKDILSRPRLATRLRDDKVYAAVQKTYKHMKVSPGVQVKDIMLVERNNNLRDASRRPTEGSLPRWFREGELVWCALTTPILGAKDDEAIRLWPAVVDEVKLNVHRENRPVQNDVAEEVSTPWVTRQSTTYKVQFLAISRSYVVPDTMVIPYQSHIVSEAVLHRMVHRPIEDWDFDEQRLSRFDPCPADSPPPSYTDTLTPFAVALQIASVFSGFWCLTDDWEAKLSLPPAASRPPPPPSSLQSAIEFAGTNNAYNGSISSGPNPNRGQAPPQTRIATQTRFQGMWWGGERIWADDLVRLKVPRSCLAPAGAYHIFAPSGCGAKGKAIAEAQGADPSAYGAASRGVFMKIDVIFVVDSAPGTGAKRECRVSGMLYELADEDWEDPNLPRKVDSLSNGAAQAPSDALPVGQPSKANAHASSDAYALPPPPIGFKFRPILPVGYDAVMSLSLVSGRYYPGILRHPLMKPYINEVIPLDPTTMLGAAHLWTLEGLFGGFKNSVDPTKYKGHRQKMMDDATKEAVAALEEHVMDRRSKEMKPDPETIANMDVKMDETA
ncbi:hypothetical protein B0H10DRAFT_1876393 [Mycena sp. CBHHK59/15]|nr:hypothetical protein B0H10DRAFT_1876393 [Mycena sp. CBHHK59/15]